MGIIVDLIIILIISACVYGGYRHGLARCLLKFLTSILAIIIAACTMQAPYSKTVNNVLRTLFIISTISGGITTISIIIRLLMIY